MATEKLIISTGVLSAIVASLIFMVVLFVVDKIGPRIEGSLFPVAWATEVEVEFPDDDVSVIKGVMQKARDCDFIGMVAYQVGIEGRRIVTPFDRHGTIKIRPTGEFEWGPWVLRLPIWTYERTEVEFIVQHRCHPFWVTETIFYNSKIPTKRGN